MPNSRKLPSSSTNIGLDCPSSGSKDTIWKGISFLFIFNSLESSFENGSKHQVKRKFAVFLRELTLSSYVNATIVIEMNV